MNNFWEWDRQRDFSNACKSDNVDEVKRLIAQGVDVNEQDGHGWPGLIIAMHNDCVATVKVLLARDDIRLDNTSDDGKRTGLHWACTYNCVESVKLFLAHPACTTQIVTMKDGYDYAADILAGSYGYNCARLIKEFLDKNGYVPSPHVEPAKPEKMSLTLPEIFNDIQRILGGNAVEAALKEDEKYLEVEQEFKMIPNCDVCMEVMKPPLQIFNCDNGHLICSTCRPSKKHCHCMAMYRGRATAMEQMIRQILGGM